MSREKRPDRAIEIASALGLPLKIAAKIDRADEPYFRETIAPLLDRPGVQFLGEIGERDKARFLGDAIALLFPIDWPEPFGLVMIESMACATPVLAFRGGSTPEIVEERVTGCLVSTLEEAIHIMPELLRIDRRGVRRRFEEQFSAQRMAADYLRLYRTLNRSAEMRLGLRHMPPRLYVVPPPSRKGPEHLAN
jgi:glycosyltransferase involved in cell wall biosynthesis